MTNAISNNFGSLTNIPATPVAGEQIASSTSIEDLTMAQSKVDGFSSSISATNQIISGVESQINAATNENTKKELKSKKEELISRKKELEQKKSRAKNRMAQLKSEIENFRSTTESTRSELNKLTANKVSLEKTIQNENKELNVKNQSLANVNNKISDTKTQLDQTILELNAAVSEVQKQSEDDLKMQRKAISAATSEALELVQSGQITAEDMPSYIAGKISDYTSVGHTAPSVVLDSHNEKVKALCTEISNYVGQQGNIQLQIKASANKLELVSPLIDSLSSKIQTRSSELKTNESFLSQREYELNQHNSEYVNSDLELTNIDTEIATITTQIVETEVQGPAAPTAETNEEMPQVQYPQFFMGSPSGVPEINIDAEISKISASTSQILKQEVKNTETDTLRAKMSDADKLITTLRNHLSDNAQKIIEERLQATKRS